MVAKTGGPKGRPANTDFESVADYSHIKSSSAPRAYSPEIKKEWVRIWKIGTWLHREQHLPLVKQYCDVLNEILECEKALQDYEIVVGESTSRSFRMANGAWAPYPEVRLIKEHYAMITSLLRELRFTPGTSPLDSGAMKEKLAMLTTQNRGM